MRRSHLLVAGVVGITSAGVLAAVATHSRAPARRAAVASRFGCPPGSGCGKQPECLVEKVSCGSAHGCAAGAYYKITQDVSVGVPGRPTCGTLFCGNPSGTGCDQGSPSHNACIN